MTGELFVSGPCGKTAEAEMFLEALQHPNDSAAETNAGCRQFQFLELADVRIPLDISHNGTPLCTLNSPGANPPIRPRPPQLQKIVLYSTANSPPGLPPRRQLPRGQNGHHRPPILLRARPAILLAAARKIQHPPEGAHWRHPPAHHHAADGRVVEHDDRE